MRAQAAKEERPQKIILDERELFEVEAQSALAAAILAKTPRAQPRKIKTTKQPKIAARTYF
ncbi:hypothetical protein [Campylobacter showae]|uniref:hypothetical protein n=1 Tax=Campylobacter showae TaxID=204 RepID=UPI001F138CB8|nr:hypothetical protein [Campylobacter showae]